MLMRVFHLPLTPTALMLTPHFPLTLLNIRSIPIHQRNSYKFKFDLVQDKVIKIFEGGRQMEQ
jgi:hypothetical protein